MLPLCLLLLHHPRAAATRFLEVLLLPSQGISMKRESRLHRGMLSLLVLLLLLLLLKGVWSYFPHQFGSGAFLMEHVRSRVRRCGRERTSETLGIIIIRGWGGGPEP